MREGERASAREGTKDYWDLVFDQLGRRAMFKVALAVLAVLYASAIYAPLLANDRPYVLDAIDYRAYEQAQRTLYPATLNLARLIEEGRGAHPAGSALTWEAALGAEADAGRNFATTMRTYLPDGAATERLDALIALVDDAVAAALDGRVDEASARAREAKEAARVIRAELAPRRTAGGEERATGVELVPLRSYPLLETITGTEAFFMALWAFVLSWPLWNRAVNARQGGDRARIRALRRKKLVVPLAASVAFGVLWGLVVGGSMTFEVGPFKKRLTDGDIVATRASFPPLSFGFAESNSGEHFRPPTWTRESTIDDEGYYVYGARAAGVDAVSGFRPPGAPVHERFSEPPRNAPLRHPLGTDSSGRDLLTRLLWGGRVSLSVGLVSAFLLVVIGVSIGACAGYFGGWIDLTLSRFIEVVLCFPAFFLILMVVAFTDPKVVPPILAIVVVIACVRWTGVARLTRGEFLKLREREFTVAARALGVPTHRVILRHVLPNAVGPILVAGAFSVAAGILTESALSFLGFGVKHPVPSWGSIVNESQSAEHWWIQLFPGLVIFVTVVCYNLVGEAIRDAVDPRMKVA